jgi:hypothetical protein
MENVDTDAEKLPESMRRYIAKQGEESFLRTIIRMIRKHVRVQVDWDKKSVSVTVANQVLWNSK